MSKTFNSDFYVVCATVIPVLFLAVAVQGSTYKSILDAALKTAQQAKVSDSLGRGLLAIVSSHGLNMIGWLICAAGACGEIFALQVLYVDHEFPGSRVTVFLATYVLIIAVAAGPIYAFQQMGSRISKQFRMLTEDLTKDSQDLTKDSEEEQPALPHETIPPGNIAKGSSGLGWPKP